MEGVTTLYAHALEVFVQAGDSVVRGQVIARVGQTGRALAPHLHFELRRQRAAIDPLPFMDEHS
jgi:murein DD-endopeptidase MepM/ murein hydrolase activator NlpD